MTDIPTELIDKVAERMVPVLTPSLGITEAQRISSVLAQATIEALELHKESTPEYHHPDAPVLYHWVTPWERRKKKGE